MKHAVTVTAALLLLLAAAAPPTDIRPEIVTDDVDRFYAVYDAAGGRPTVEQLQRDYLDEGSDGLDEFARIRRITGERIAAAIAERPEIYVDARQCAVTIAIGRGKPVGTANAAAGVMIGLEALCAVDFFNPDVEERFVSVIAHEYVHVQQPSAQAEDSGDTVLQAALLEGGAEFVTELITGSVSYGHLAPATRGRERELETEFLADQDLSAMGSDWLYNGMGTPERPGDLGYWVGYRIAKAYYQGAEDKQAALRDIIEVRDAKALIAKSGWYPGIVLG